MDCPDMLCACTLCICDAVWRKSDIAQRYDCGKIAIKFGMAVRRSVRKYWGFHIVAGSGPGVPSVRRVRAVYAKSCLWRGRVVAQSAQ